MQVQAGLMFGAVRWWSLGLYGFLHPGEQEHPLS